MLACRFSYNWIKLRAWQLTEYDAILMLDSDMTVVRPPLLLYSSVHIGRLSNFRQPHQLNAEILCVW